MKRSRVSAWRAEPAWMVVKPLTPDDSVSSSGSASGRGPRRRWRRRAPCAGTRRPAAAGRPGRSARAARVCIAGDVGQRDVGLEDLLGHHDPQGGVELGGAARQQGGLARARRAGEDDREAPGPHAGPQELGGRPGVSMSRSTSSSSSRNATPVNLRMFTMTWPPRATSPWTMCRRAPSSSWASCRPSVGSSLRWAPEASSRILVRVRTTCSSSWKTSSW
jgi:hypothetical protein